MKTKNNVQKTILRGAAVVVSFVLISYTVSAQEFWKKLITNSSFNEIAIAMVDVSGKTKKTATDQAANPAATNQSKEYEPALNLEFWMTSENYFGQKTFKELQEAEPELQLENWMLNDKYFEGTAETEQPLNLENWMTSDKFWES